MDSHRATDVRLFWQGQDSATQAAFKGAPGGHQAAGFRLPPPKSLAIEKSFILDREFDKPAPRRGVFRALKLSLDLAIWTYFRA
jgi:hypothetical protein